MAFEEEVRALRAATEVLMGRAGNTEGSGNSSDVSPNETTTPVMGTAIPP